MLKAYQTNPKKDFVAFSTLHVLLFLFWQVVTNWIGCIEHLMRMYFSTYICIAYAYIYAQIPKCIELVA